MMVMMMMMMMMTMAMNIFTSLWNLMLSSNVNYSYCKYSSMRICSFVNLYDSKYQLSVNSCRLVASCLYCVMEYFFFPLSLMTHICCRQEQKISVYYCYLKPIYINLTHYILTIFITLVAHTCHMQNKSFSRWHMHSLDLVLGHKLRNYKQLHFFCILNNPPPPQPPTPTPPPLPLPPAHPSVNPFAESTPSLSQIWVRVKWLSQWSAVWFHK